MGMYYKLVGRSVTEASAEEFRQMFEEDDARRIARTERDGITVSTVFLGLDHGFGYSAQPVVFETLVFGGEQDGEMERCCTFEEAEAMHARVCATVFGKSAHTGANILSIGRKLALD